MANEEKQNPATTQEADISKAQSQQQPPAQASQQSSLGEETSAEQTGDQAATGQAQGASPDEGLQGDTLAQQRTDIEGASGQAPETSGAEGGFVGAEGQADTSSELVEDEEDFGKDGQGAPEGK